MKLDSIFIEEPNKPGVKSVSLTLAIWMTVIFTVLGIMQAFNKVQSMGPFLEAFWSSWALYLGRRINIKGKAYSSEKASKIEKHVREHDHE